MGAWGTEWNANDRVADLVGDISATYKYDALNSARNIVVSEAKGHLDDFEELIDYYRASAMIYKNITLSLSGYKNILDDERKTFASANKIIEEFLSSAEDNPDYDSVWVDFDEYVGTVRSELHEFQEWLQTD